MTAKLFRSFMTKLLLSGKRQEKFTSYNIQCQRKKHSLEIALAEIEILSTVTTSDVKELS